MLATAISLLLHAALFAALTALTPHLERESKGQPDRDTMTVRVAPLLVPTPPAPEPEPPAPEPSPPEPKPPEPTPTVIPPAPEPSITTTAPAPMQMPPVTPQNTRMESARDTAPRPTRKAAPAAPGRGEPTGTRNFSSAVCTFRASPEFPAAARAERKRGTVVIVVQLDATGRVQSARVATSSGDARLDAAALSAAQRSRFRPATRDGAPVASEVRIPYTFALQ